MGNIPTNIQLPTTPPTTDPAVAGYIAQFQIALNQWILQAATAINNSLTTLTIGDWTITEDSNGNLILTFNSSPSGSWTIPNPAGQNLIVRSV